MTQQDQHPLNFSYDPSKSTEHCMSVILEAAVQLDKAPAVAAHLVGAALQLACPHSEIENRSFSTAEEQRGRPWDYAVGDTAFHINIAPMQGVYERCVLNLNRGMRVYLLVPQARLAGALENASLASPGRITVLPIESFLSQNIDELSGFSQAKLTDEFRRLLEMYNERVDAIENDKSLLIEIPPNLLPSQ